MRRSSIRRVLASLSESFSGTHVGTSRVLRNCESLGTILEGQSRQACSLWASNSKFDQSPWRRLHSPTSSHSLQQQRHFIGDNEVGKHHHERKLLGSVVTAQERADYLEAELEVGFKMFVERYTSQVYMTQPSKVMSKVSDSTLFDHLDTTWEFKAGPTPSTTWLNFDLSFAFKSPLYRHIASIFFDEVVKRMMNAFEGRCQTLYGESSLQQKRKMHA